MKSEALPWPLATQLLHVLPQRRVVTDTVSNFADRGYPGLFCGGSSGGGKERPRWGGDGEANSRWSQNLGRLAAIFTVADRTSGGLPSIPWVKTHG